MRRAISLAALLLLAWPAAAAAGTVSITSFPIDKYLYTYADSMQYTAAPGERNDVTVAPGAEGTWVIRDAGAPVTVSDANCILIDAHAARCRPYYVFQGPSVDTGDLDDVVHGTGVGSFAGGEGDDMLSNGRRLSGGAGDDVLVGTSAVDELYGGPGSDVLRGLGGNDYLYGDEDPRSGIGDVPGVMGDVLDGGAGLDLASYRSRPDGVRVDLAAGVGGGSGEHDTLVGIENVDGGEGADVMAGMLTATSSSATGATTGYRAARGVTC